MQKNEKKKKCRDKEEYLKTQTDKNVHLSRQTAVSSTAAIETTTTAVATTTAITTNGPHVQMSVQRCEVCVVEQTKPLQKAAFYSLAFFISGGIHFKKQKKKG